MTDWQPIETAPKDGTSILVTIFHDDGSYWGQDIVWWDDWTKFWASGGYDWMKVKYDDTENITHWMPLPPPPKKENE